MRIRLLAAIVFLACSCSKGDRADVGSLGNNGISGVINIRIWNDSRYNMDYMFVDTGGGENDYGTVKRGERSSYEQYQLAYRYAFVSFKINGKAFNIQPLDYVGETPLKEGKYTYRIVVDDLNSHYAYLEFIEEK